MGYNISGNCMCGCACNGPPPASNVDTITLAEDAAAAAGFVNPDTVHTTAVVGDAVAAAVDRFSSNTPVDGEKAADTVTVDRFRLEQDEEAAVALKAEKRKPAMDMSLKAVEFRAGAATTDSVNTTPVVADMWFESDTAPLLPAA